MAFETQEQKIMRMHKAKLARWDKTALSIQISWAINNASAFVPEKLKGTKKGFSLIKKWYPSFLDLYRDWMMDNLPMSEEEIWKELIPYMQSGETPPQNLLDKLPKTGVPISVVREAADAKKQQVLVPEKPKIDETIPIVEVPEDKDFDEDEKYDPTWLEEPEPSKD